MAGHRLILGKRAVFVEVDNIFEFQGFTFSWHAYCGPVKLKKDWTSAKKTGKRFYDAIDKWYNLPKARRKKFQVCG